MGAIALLIVIGLIVGAVFEVWWPFAVIVVLLSAVFVKKLQKPEDGETADIHSGRGAAVDAEDTGFCSKDEPRKSPGKCSGDCANCPPHYGYRYGRWYYGRHHIHGCEFGGNRGDGEID